MHIQDYMKDVAECEKVLLEVAKNIAKHLINRDGWTPDDTCFQVDLTDASVKLALYIQTRCLDLETEVARLKRGDFTPEEFQHLCHHRDEKPGCTPHDFMIGCQLYQRQLFGTSSIDELEVAADDAYDARNAAMRELHRLRTEKEQHD